jgi:hypothetical protein
MTPRTEITDAMFDPAEWAKKGFTERVRLASEAYVLEGIGLPLAAYLFHAIKLCLLVAGWFFVCSFTPGLGDPRTVGSWWSRGSPSRRRSSGRACSRSWASAACAARSA